MLNILFDRVLKKTRSLALVLVFLVSGCATQMKEFVYSFDYEKGMYPPTRIHLNRFQPVANFYMSRLYEVRAELKRSRNFLDISALIDSPYVLDITLTEGTTSTLPEQTGTLLSKVKNFNIMKVDFYSDGKLVKSYEYKEHYEDSIITRGSGVTEYDVRSNEFISIRNLVNRFLQDFDKDNLMPRLVREKQRNDIDG